MDPCAPKKNQLGKKPIRLLLRMGGWISTPRESSSSAAGDDEAGEITRKKRRTNLSGSID
uniref:Uncharacterized protein n=1 Tax=Arundo donax TaxID=35708 RepID=A0A0A9F719_ARUDO